MGKLFLLFWMVMLLLIPIYLDIAIYYDVDKRKFAFSVHMYKWIKLFGGYLATYKGGLALHISQKKAVIVPYQELQDEQKRISFFRIFRLKYARILLESNDENLHYLLWIYHALRVYFFTKQGRTNKIHNFICINQEYDGIKTAGQIVVVFCLLSVIRNLLKLLKEQLQKICQKKTKRLAN